MKYLATIFLLFFVLIGFSQKKKSIRPLIESNDKSKYGVFGKKSNFKAAERLKNYPFNKAASIQLVSFSGDGGQIEPSLKIKEGMPNQRTYLTILPFRETIDLDSSQISNLTDIFYNYGYIKRPYIQDLTKCYVPRNGILFFDSNKNVFEFLEICFDCKKTEKSSEKMSLGEEIDYKKINLLKAFFKSIGIEYGIVKD